MEEILKMGYYKNLSIEDLNKERDKVGKVDLSKWHKQQLLHFIGIIGALEEFPTKELYELDKKYLVTFLYAIKVLKFKAFFEGYRELERIQKGD